MFQHISPDFVAGPVLKYERDLIKNRDVQCAYLITARKYNPPYSSNVK